MLEATSKPSWWAISFQKTMVVSAPRSLTKPEEVFEFPKVEIQKWMARHQQLCH
jgi:hypothetical protein